MSIKFVCRISSSSLPPELKGVNLEVALQECYERMAIIGVNTAEVRVLEFGTNLMKLKTIIIMTKDSSSKDFGRFGIY